MNYYPYWQKIKENWRTITLIVLVVVTLSLITSLLSTPVYQATTRVLVTQSTNLNMDMYQASQSAERLAMLWAKIIKSSSFLKDVLDSGFPIDKKYFPGKEKELRKKWAEMVDARVSTDTSIIEINVYHPQREEAKKIANAIVYIFTNKSKKYYNLGNDINITLIDTPLVSERPVKPNLALNLILSFLVGLVLSAIFIAWKTQKPATPKKSKSDDIISAPAMIAPEENIVITNQTTPAEEETPTAEKTAPPLETGRYMGGLKIVNPVK